MTSEQSNQDKVNRLIRECRAAGLLILPPDINESGSRFTVAGGAIRFGLGAVKGLGEAAIESIIEAREKGAPFAGLYDFCERVDTQKVNHRVLDTLIKCGAFDRSGQGAHRAALCLAADEALAAGARLQRDRRHGQMNMFDLLAAGDPSDSARPADAPGPATAPWPENVRLNFEKEALGFFITGHPLDRFEVELGLLDTVPVEKLSGRPDRAEVRLGGVVADLKTKKDKRGQDFAYLTLEDQTGSIEILVWAKVLEKCQAWLSAEGKEQVVVVTGTVEAGVKAEDGEKGRAVKVKANEILPLAEAFEKKTQALTLKLPRAGLDRETLALLSGAARNFRGSASVYLHLAEPGGVAVYKLQATLRPCRELVDSLGRLFPSTGA